MKQKIRILSLDIGKKGGIVLYDNFNEKYLLKEKYNFESLYFTFQKLHELNNEFHFNVIIIGEAFGQRAVVKKHSKFYGVIELWAEMNNKQVIYVSDMTARCLVLGRGFGRNKKAVHEKYKEEDENVSDAVLFSEWYLQNIS